MSSPAQDTELVERSAVIEVRLHRASPFPPLVNGALVALSLYAVYLLIASQVGQPILETRADGSLAVNSGSWAAFVLSLIFSTAVTIPALSARQWSASLPDLLQTLDEAGIRQAQAMSQGTPRGRLFPILTAFGLGVLGGLAFNAWLLRTSGLSLPVYFQSTGIWYVVVTPILFGLGARSIVQLRSDDRDMAMLVSGHLDITPAGFDRLEVYGQLALRSALAWIVMAAIILLFFVYAAPVFISVGTLVLSLLAGAYAFSSTIAPVVRATSALRAEALQNVRTAIEAEASSTLDATPNVAVPSGRLADLVAYETWLASRPVWPISAPITRRLALYGLIPVLAWFGAAAAELVLGRIA